MLEVKQLKQLVAMVELGSVTAAAEHLHISQPSLTAHLARLESLLGDKLFIRSAKGLEAIRSGETNVAVGAFGAVVGLHAQMQDTSAQFMGFFAHPKHVLLQTKHWFKQLHEFPLAAPQIPSEFYLWLQHQGVKPAAQPGQRQLYPAKAGGHEYPACGG